MGAAFPFEARLLPWPDVRDAGILMPEQRILEDEGQVEQAGKAMVSRRPPYLGGNAHRVYANFHTKPLGIKDGKFRNLLLKTRKGWVRTDLWDFPGGITQQDQKARDQGG